MNAQMVVAACFLLLGVAHTALGESAILRPLFLAEWTVSEPRWAVERILRFAWHLTSITWFALAAIVVGADPLPTIGVMSIASAAIIFVMLRGHLAWPLFLLAGLAAFRADGLLDTPLLRIGAVATTAALAAAAMLHIYWAAGGRWMADTASPPSGDTTFSPPAGLTLAVAGALAGFAALVTLVALDMTAATTLLRWPLGVGIAILTIRAIGDTKQVGFTKTTRDTDFARADDRYFTPLIVLLALGSTGSLIS